MLDRGKAFLQIIIKEKKRNFFRFLLFHHAFSDQHKLVFKRFPLAVFGVTSSLFLLNQTIQKHESIDSLYGDNFAGGADNFKKALELFKN